MQVKLTNTDLPNTYRSSTTETIMHPIDQNILLVYPHFGIALFHRGIQKGSKRNIKRNPLRTKPTLVLQCTVSQVYLSTHVTIQQVNSTASTTMDLDISIFLIYVSYVTLRHLGLLVKTDWSVNCPLLLLITLAVGLLLLFAVHITVTGPLRIQPWSQDRRNQTKSNRQHVRRKAGRADRRQRTRK